MTAAHPLPGDLTLRGVDVRAGGITILSGIDVALRPGELTGLIGPSGAGKTTLIKTLLGLRRPAAGEVHLGGAGPVGYVPQSENSLEVGEQCKFSLKEVRAVLDFMPKDSVRRWNAPCHVGDIGVR